MRGMKTCQGALEKFWQWQRNRCGSIKPVFALSAFSPASFALIPKGTETTSPTLLCDFCCVAPQQGHTCLHIRTPLGPRRRKRAAHDSRFRSAVQDNFPESHSKRVEFGQQAGTSMYHTGGNLVPSTAYLLKCPACVYARVFVL